MIDIREATPEDAPQIARIHADMWREHYSFMPEEVFAARDYGARLKQWVGKLTNQDPDDFILVVTDGDQLVGFTSVTANKDDAVLQAKGEMHAAYFLPDYRGHRIGVYALDRMIKHLVNRDLWPAVLWAFRDNPMRKKYEETGWTAVVHRDRIISGIALPEVGYLSPADPAALYPAMNRRRLDAEDASPQNPLQPPSSQARSARRSQPDQ